MTETTTKIVLTDDQLNQLELVADQAVAFDTYMIAVWRAVMGDEAYEEATTLDPKLYAIPDAQWIRLCETAQRCAGRISSDREAKLHGALRFMNIGPSGYSSVE